MAIPYSKRQKRTLRRTLKGSKYEVKVVERDTLEAKLYLQDHKSATVSRSSRKTTAKKH